MSVFSVCMCCRAGVPDLQAVGWYRSRPIRNWATQQEVSLNVNVIRLNHPKTIPPPWSVGKLSSIKPVPGAKQVGTTAVDELLIS